MPNTWAIEGLRCLDIDLTPAKFGESIAFASLGVDPSLRITLVNQRRWQWLGAAVGLAMFIYGLMRTSNRFSSRFLFALAMIIGSMVFALATGWTMEMEPIIQAVITSGLTLVALTILVSLSRKLFRRSRDLVRRRRAAQASATIPTASIVSSWLVVCLTASMLALSNSTAHAQSSPGTPVSNIAELAALIDALQAIRRLPFPPMRLSCLMTQRLCPMQRPQL